MARSRSTFSGKWKNSPTKVVRVPSAIADQILEYAQTLDQYGVVEPLLNYASAYTVALSRPVNVASVPHRSPFRYPGGKTWLVPYLRTWMGSKDRTPELAVEPFAGGGTATLTFAAEHLAACCIMSELDEDVASVWETVLGADCCDLIAKLTNFDVNEETVGQVLNHKPSSTLERAFQTILRNRVQRGGILAAGAGLVKNGENGKGLLSRWYPETLAKRMRDVSTLANRITFRRADAFEVIAEFSTFGEAVFFVDPPYTKAAKRLYHHWDIDHGRLFEAMANVAGDFLMTYDATEEVRALASRFGLSVREVSMKNTHHSAQTELLIGRDFTWLDAAQASLKLHSQTLAV